MRTVVVTLTPKDQAAKDRITTWASKTEKGGIFKKEFNVQKDGTTTFKMTCPVNMTEDMIEKFFGKIINNSIIDRINKEKINTGISIKYE